ncbi:MAG: hypothetical protein H6739_01970 [Alphaproteobacteria bacterium]|nr:hypothetical protein [Alphaproteobacteria bacterium]
MLPLLTALACTPYTLPDPPDEGTATVRVEGLDENWRTGANGQTLSRWLIRYGGQVVIADASGQVPAATVNQEAHVVEVNGLPPGRWTLWATRGWGGLIVAELDLAPGETLTVDDWTEEPRIHGAIVDSDDGSPVTTPSVMAACSPAVDTHEHRDFRLWCTAPTDAEGRFALSSPEGEPAFVIAHWPHIPTLAVHWSPQVPREPITLHPRDPRPSADLSLLAFEEEPVRGGGQVLYDVDYRSAWSESLEPGDIVLALNNVPMTALEADDLRRVAPQIDEPPQLLVRRGRRMLTLDGAAEPPPIPSLEELLDRGAAP